MQVHQEEIRESVERSVRLYQSLINGVDLKRFREVAENVSRAIKPISDFVQSESFQIQLKSMNRIVNDTIPIIEKFNGLTLPSIQAIEKIYQIADGLSKSITSVYSVPEKKREEVITAPIFTEVRKQIYAKVPSIKKISPLELPSDTKWGDVRTRFISSQFVLIEIPKYKVQLHADYHDMGMWDARSGKPNAQWSIFKGLAQYGGEISWETPIAHPRVKKQKQLLSNALKRYFNIAGDPFFIYHKEKAYRLKMILLPEESLAEKDEFGIAEHIKESMPQMHDPYENR